MAKNSRSTAKKWAFRIGTLLIWVYVLYVNTSAIEKWPPPAQVEGFYLDNARPWRVLVYILLALLAIRVFGKARAVYFTTFPIWAPFYMLWGVLKVFGVNVKRLNGVASPKVGTICIAFMVVCYFVIHDLTNRYFVYAGVVALIVLSVLVVYGVFLWAMRPLAGLNGFIDKLIKYCEKEAPGDEEKIGSASSEGNTQFLQNRLKTEEAWLKSIQWFERVVLTPQRVVGLFCIVLVFSVLLIELNYSVAYWGLNKMDVAHYSAPEDGRGFWDFAYFGLMVMTTSDWSEIMPVSSFAKVLTATQLVCSVVLLSLLILAFSTSGHGDVSSATVHLGRLREKRQKLYDMIKGSGAIEEAEIDEIDGDGTGEESSE